MNKEQAEEYAKTMTYTELWNNIACAKGIKYRKATLTKLYELIKEKNKESSDENIQGEWITQEVCPPEYHGKHFCSKCGRQGLNEGYKEYLSNFCPNCGAKMVESQESEDKE